ncbi:FadR/GntR family transcriptional regulator [Microbacterium sp. NPDC056052]|uniref:FadR/GntR family transcriptional regulator n=1 Tax=Microbacterium sp. NPDC056052 TaxID=3345695 RepID=UPI0035DEED31
MPQSSAGRTRPELLDVAPGALDPKRRGRPNRLSTAVSEELLRRIISGEYPIGTLLPPEPQLVAEFDVSRPVAREAVKFLEAAGLVSIRQGEGTVVRESSRWNFLEPSVLRIALALNVGKRIRADAVQLRLDLDLSLLAEAAPLLIEDDYVEMEAHLHTMDTEKSFSRLQAADLAFHRVYQSRAGNQLTEGIVHLLVEEMPPPNRVIANPRDSYDHANRQHWAIYEALRAGRAEDALTTLREHISQMWTWREETPPA